MGGFPDSPKLLLKTSQRHKGVSPLSIRKTSRAIRSNPVQRKARQGSVKQRTHERILESARNIAQREGLRAASVQRVMAGARLTVGGFYAHFKSKTAMDVEIVRSMLGKLPNLSLSGFEHLAGLDWTKFAVDKYLTAKHRDARLGCPYPVVLSEVASAPVAVRNALAEKLESRVRAFEAHAVLVEGITARERALATMALTIGGLLLARATKGNSISDELLLACERWALPEFQAQRRREK
jgi:TetR/AcrR family transcriptional repressor of nem operon